MDRSSINILESLQYKIPKIRSIYNLLEISVGSSCHDELNNIISCFEDPTIVIAIGLYTSCLIIQRETKSKVSVIEIAQETIYYKTTTGKLKSHIIDILRASDFVPEPLIRKIAIISSYDNTVIGDIYYEVARNKYSKDKSAISLYKDISNSDIIGDFDILKDIIKEIR